MIEGLPPIEVLTPSALLGLTIFLILRGYLVPRKTYDDKAHEADEWRTEGRIKDQTIHELTEQNNLLLRDLVPVVSRLLDSLHGQPRDREVDNQ